MATRLKGPALGVLSLIAGLAVPVAAQTVTGPVESRGVKIIPPEAEAEADPPVDSAQHPSHAAPPAGSTTTATSTTAAITAPTPPSESPSTTSGPPQPVVPAPVAPATATVVAKPPLRAPVAVVPVIKACDRPFAEPDIKLASADGFNRALSSKLKRQRRVVVDLAQPFAAEAEAPAPLASWLSEVKAAGGNVSVRQYCAGTRGFGSWLAKVLGDSKPKSSMRAARRYDVILHADALDRVVTQVEFTPKSGAKGS